MRTTLYAAFRHEFIAVSGESRPGLPPAEAARDLFARITPELHAHGLSLADTVRTPSGDGTGRRATAVVGRVSRCSLAGPAPRAPAISPRTTLPGSRLLCRGE